MKLSKLGLLATMFGFSAMGSSLELSNPYQNLKPKHYSKGWRNSTPSPYFGQRSMIITAYTNKGEFKQMKLKNALKKDFPVSELGQVWAEKDGSVHFSEEFKSKLKNEKV